MAEQQGKKKTNKRRRTPTTSGGGRKRSGAKREAWKLKRAHRKGRTPNGAARAKRRGAAI